MMRSHRRVVERISLLGDAFRRTHSGLAAVQPTSSNTGNVTFDSATLDLYSRRLAELARSPSAKRVWKYAVENPRKASVLVPLGIDPHDGKPCVLFTVRSSKLRKHRGEVSFPGGSKDEEDKSLVMTALRETEEEIGFSPSRIQVLGEHLRLPDRSERMEVTPVLAYVGPIDKSSIQYNQSEVADVFTLTLDELLEPDRKSMMLFRDTTDMWVPTWKGPNDVVIWGLTAYILDVTLRTIIFPDMKELYPGT
ncbi:NUDIX hydrolase domain-like protein [Cladochytrium replicatum]|nr:NUDIX hydrolase domain-like protein [Cladochytrium replicatum]